MDWHPIQGGVLRNTSSHFMLQKPKIGVSVMIYLAHMQTLPLLNGRDGEMHCEHHVRAIYVAFSTI